MTSERVESPIEGSGVSEGGDVVVSVGGGGVQEAVGPQLAHSSDPGSCLPTPPAATTPKEKKKHKKSKADDDAAAPDAEVPADAGLASAEPSAAAVVATVSRFSFDTHPRTGWSKNERLRNAKGNRAAYNKARLEGLLPKRNKNKNKGKKKNAIPVESFSVDDPEILADAGLTSDEPSVAASPAVVVSPSGYVVVPGPADSSVLPEGKQARCHPPSPLPCLLVRETRSLTRSSRYRRLFLLSPADDAVGSDPSALTHVASDPFLRYKLYYAFLGLTSTATHDKIRKAYLKKSRDLHPDRNRGDANATVKQQLLNEAKEVLLNPELRYWYDTAGGIGFGAAKRTLERGRSLDNLEDWYRTYGTLGLEAYGLLIKKFDRSFPLHLFKWYVLSLDGEGYQMAAELVIRGVPDSRVKKTYDDGRKAALASLLDKVRNGRDEGSGAAPPPARKSAKPEPEVELTLFQGVAMFAFVIAMFHFFYIPSLKPPSA
jgi:curved DNA-binding protein CbpA